MSFLNLDQAREDYAQWVTGTDDPPTLTEEEARLLSFRITAHHFPNLLAAHEALRAKVTALADELDGLASSAFAPRDARAAQGLDATEEDRIAVTKGFALGAAAQRLRALIPTSQGDETSE